MKLTWTGITGAVFLLIGLAFLVAGIAGLVQGTLPFRLELVAEAHNKAVYLAWYTALLGETFLAAGGYLMARIRKAWILVWSCILGSLCTSLVLGCLYSFYDGLMILGNDSRSWEALERQKSGFLMTSMGIGGIVGLVVLGLYKAVRTLF